MCKRGDIILVDNYVDGEVKISRHSFLVLDDQGGKIEGLSYDFMCNVLSSIKSPKQRERKLSYPGNFPISHNDTETDPDNGRDGYIKADQLYYFRKDKLSFRCIGSIHEDVLEQLILFIENGSFEVKQIIDNL